MVPPGGQGVGTVLQKGESLGGMDEFRFTLCEGQGLTNPNVIQPGETFTFVLTVLAADGQLIDAESFNVAFINNQGTKTGFSKVGAKFVSCLGQDWPTWAGGTGGSDPTPERPGLAPASPFREADAPAIFDQLFRILRRDPWLDPCLPRPG